MAEESKKRRTIKKLRDKYTLKIFNENTYEEVFSFKLSRLNVFVFTGLFVFFLTAIIIVLISFTGLREFIPGYPDGRIQRMMVLNAMKVDSLELQLKLQDRYFENIKNIVEGKNPHSIELSKDTTIDYSNIKFTRSKEDSILRQKIEQDEQFNLQSGTDSYNNTALSHLHFLNPINGFISSKFDPGINHYAIDIVANENEAVLATLPGTVVISTWTPEHGNIIQIQHQHDLVSVYKHNSKLLKQTGDFVKVGEPIAIIGNTGDLTTGTHLHFELWYKGKAIDPEKYLNFENK